MIPLPVVVHIAEHTSIRSKRIDVKRNVTRIDEAQRSKPLDSFCFVFTSKLVSQNTQVPKQA